MELFLNDECFPGMGIQRSSHLSNQENGAPLSSGRGQAVPEGPGRAAMAS